MALHIGTLRIHFAPLFPSLLGSGSAVTHRSGGGGGEDTHAVCFCAAASFFLHLRTPGLEGVHVSVESQLLSHVFSRIRHVAYK